LWALVYVGGGRGCEYLFGTNISAVEWITLDSVMDGKHLLNVSHAGGELSALTDMADEWDELCMSSVTYFGFFSLLTYSLAVISIVSTTGLAEIAQSSTLRLFVSRWWTLLKPIWNGVM